MLHPGHIENQVLVGHDGYLFLAGGAHNVLDVVSGKRKVPEASLDAFVGNLKSRAEWASRHAAKFIHIIFPDKQTILPEAWPFELPLAIGSNYLARCEGLDQDILYPVEFLRQHSTVALSRVDTHLTAFGGVLMAGYVGSKIAGDDLSKAALELAHEITAIGQVSGDLGAKLSPPISLPESVCRKPAAGPFFHNNIKGNNGITDLRFNKSARFSKRVVIFGDSFARQFAIYLQFWFSEVAFFRTAYFHEEVANLLCPDVIITENSERYLDFCGTDEQRPNYFMLPHLGGQPYQPSREFAEAFSAILSYPRTPYRRFIERL